MPSLAMMSTKGYSFSLDARNGKKRNNDQEALLLKLHYESVMFWSLPIVT
jgi:hypothetical protein